MASLKITAADRGPDGRILTAPPEPPVIGGQAGRAANTIGIAVAGIGLALVLIVGTQWASRGATPPDQAAAIPAAPTATPAPTPHTISAYWAPDGPQVPAPIAAATAYHFIGRLGASWAQVQLPGGGEVWVRLSDLPLDAHDQAALAAAPDRATSTPEPPTIQCYTVRLDVSDDHGTPIGIAEGYSCESYEAAQANAAAQADQVRAAHERK
jgi:hypothetical protein